LTGNVASSALAKNVVAVGATDNYTPLDVGNPGNTLLGANNSQGLVLSPCCWQKLAAQHALSTQGREHQLCFWPGSITPVAGCCPTGANSSVLYKALTIRRHGQGRVTKGSEIWAPRYWSASSEALDH
ncbi:hypothetical protein HaLaN_33138, partial [Haematococcus lacustris]